MANLLIAFQTGSFCRLSSFITDIYGGTISILLVETLTPFHEIMHVQSILDRVVMIVQCVSIEHLQNLTTWRSYFYIGMGWYEQMIQLRLLVLHSHCSEIATNKNSLTEFIGCTIDGMMEFEICRIIIDASCQCCWRIDWQLINLLLLSFPSCFRHDFDQTRLLLRFLSSWRSELVCKFENRFAWFRCRLAKQRSINWVPSRGAFPEGPSRYI